MDLLEKARAEIERIDREMAALFEQRMQAVEQVAQVKKERGLAVFDAGREAVLGEKNSSYIQNPVYRDYYRTYLRFLMDLAKQYQNTLLNREKIGYQGTEGAFAHIALHRIFPQGSSVSYRTYEDVFRAVEAGEVAYGVIPFENSYAGEVGEVLDLLMQYPCYIHQVYDLRIKQNLLAPPGATLQDIKQVYSHHQAISQCQQFLQTYDFEVIPYPNTATAAKYVSETQDRSKAAIASVETAKLYGLHVLVANINTSSENTTRFIVIGKEAQKEGNRFSLLFTLKHEAGQLAKVMQIIGNLGFNVESIKSRPLRNLPWQYYFYVEVVGDLADEKTAALLESLQHACKKLKVLGAYTL